MVMSGMDRHMISGTWDGIGFVEVGSLGCGLVTVRLRDAIEIIIQGDEVVIYLLEYLRHRVNHCFLQVKPEYPSLLLAFISYFPHLLSSNHKSTQTCIYHYFRLN
jgi:hypothetical protein